MCRERIEAEANELEDKHTTKVEAQAGREDEIKQQIEQCKAVCHITGESVMPPGFLLVLVVHVQLHVQILRSSVEGAGNGLLGAALESMQSGMHCAGKMKGAEDR